MTLSCSRPFSAQTYAPGIYVNEVTILQAEDISGELLPFFDNPVDIGIKLTLNIGRDFNPEMTIAGSFKRDPNTEEVVGWGSAFLVQEALLRLGYTENLEQGNRIHSHVFQEVVGKKFLKLAYVSGVRDNGKLRYYDWNQIATLEEGVENLVNRFRRSLAKGYPKNYRPDVLDQPQPLGLVA